jgi:peptidoglycan-associated lipoprotein
MKFFRESISSLTVVAALAAALTLAGCSKKTASTGTTPDPNPPQTDTNPPPDTGGGPDNVNNPSPSDATGINDVFFDYDDYNLSAEARSVLSGNAAQMKELSSMSYTIEGHCDERGTTEYNLALGQRRADAAKSYLVNLGIEASRLNTISYGEERPFESGHDESAWSQNRRAHFRNN